MDADKTAVLGRSGVGRRGGEMLFEQTKPSSGKAFGIIGLGWYFGARHGPRRLVAPRFGGRGAFRFGRGESGENDGGIFGSRSCFCAFCCVDWCWSGTKIGFCIAPLLETKDELASLR